MASMPSLPPAPIEAAAPALPKRAIAPALIAVTIFASVATAGLKIGFLTADALVLHWLYPRTRIATQHLTIVSYKPELRVSNGDILEGYGFSHFLITAILFLATAALVIPASIRLLPGPLRDRIRRASKSSKHQQPLGCLIAPVFLILAVSLSTGQSLLPNLIILTLAITLAWLFCRKADVSVPNQ
jgi:hypothetical protein